MAKSEASQGRPEQESGGEISLQELQDALRKFRDSQQCSNDERKIINELLPIVSQLRRAKDNSPLAKILKKINSPGSSITVDQLADIFADHHPQKNKVIDNFPHVEAGRGIATFLNSILKLGLTEESSSRTSGHMIDVEPADDRSASKTEQQTAGMKHEEATPEDTHRDEKIKLLAPEFVKLSTILYGNGTSNGSNNYFSPVAAERIVAAIIDQNISKVLAELEAAALAVRYDSNNNERNGYNTSNLPKSSLRSLATFLLNYYSTNEGLPTEDQLENFAGILTPAIWGTKTLNSNASSGSLFPKEMMREGVHRYAQEAADGHRTDSLQAVLGSI